MVLGMVSKPMNWSCLTLKVATEDQIVPIISVDLVILISMELDLPLQGHVDAIHGDYECELCAVIGRAARKVSAENALDYVYGYTMCWDISIRDPWGKGRHNTRNIRKGFDTFCGLGPWIVTRDEIREPQDLRIHVEQNGKPVMQAHTADMINGLRDLIRFLSSVTTLKPGTLITTGTPAGVSKLADGDHLKGTIDGIGTMELKVIEER